jgi:hypothetical protein
MPDIKKDTIAKHVRILANLGCKFKVIEADGTEHGELVVVVNAKRHVNRIEVLKLVDYKTPMKAMQVGDVISIKAPPDIPLESLRSSISGFATYKFGAGSVTTTLDRPINAVIVLRVE